MDKLNLYTKDGWLNAPSIAEYATRHRINFIIIIGKRQIGKTYNVLKYLLDSGNPFIFLRRTRTELEMLEAGANSPFEKIKEYKDRIDFRADSSYTAAIDLITYPERTGDDVKEVKEEVKRVGMGAALSTIGNIRGFSADQYLEGVFDEFIPEEHLYHVRNEGGAFLAAHDTINGNRELEGRPCFRWWLLANANDLGSDILERLNLTKDVERMTIRGDELKINNERGFMIIMPDSEGITEKRARTGLYKLIGTDNDYARMSLGNQFSKNDDTGVGARPLREYNPLCTVGNITIHIGKGEKILYITDPQKNKGRHIFTDKPSALATFNRTYPDLRVAYQCGRVYFQDMRTKNYFLEYIGVK